MAKIDPRLGSPKRLAQVQHAFGSTRRQVNTALAGGLGHATENAPDASGPTAADPTIAGKPFVGKTVPVVQGHRSRISTGADQQDLSDALLGEAFSHDRQDRIAHGRELPGDTSDVTSVRPAADPAEREELRNAKQK